MAKRIDVEGIIGAGKTTFVEEVTTRYDIQPVYEPVKDNPFLDKYYLDPKRHGFNIQMWLLAKRSSANKAAYHLSRSGVDVIVDRGRRGDRCFATVNNALGNIGDDEMRVYEEVYEALDSRDPDIIVFLDITEHEAMSRIVKRGRDCEREITLDYLRHLRSAHIDMAKEAEARGIRVIVSPTVDDLAAICGLKKLGQKKGR